MNEKMAIWSFLWFGADPRSTLSADSQWFPRLVLTPSKAQVLTPRSHLFILLLFQFCFGCLASYLVSEQTPICLKHHHSQSKTKKKKKKKILLNHHHNPLKISITVASYHYYRKPHKILRASPFASTISPLSKSLVLHPINLQ